MAYSFGFLATIRFSKTIADYSRHVPLRTVLVCFAYGLDAKSAKHKAETHTVCLVYRLGIQSPKPAMTARSRRAISLWYYNIK
jgi:hypothetical protein